MDLIKYLPSFYFNSEEVKNIQASFQNEHDDVKEAMKDVLNQLFIDSATWGLKYWEELLKIPVSDNKNTDYRRSVIKSKLRGIGITTKETIKEIAKGFVTDADVLEHNESYSFEVDLKSREGFPYKLNSLFEIIDEVKPAHLEAAYKLTSITNCKIHFGACLTSGETITVYPWSVSEISSIGKVSLGTSNYNIETVEIYPKEVI